MIQAKPKRCDGQCQEMRPIWKNHEGNRYCKTCWSYFKADQPAELKIAKPKVRIKPVSDKQQKLNMAYSMLRKLFLKTNDSCQGRLPGCQNTHGEHLTVHHSKGRGRYLLDTTTWIPLCMSCHEFVERNPEEAKTLNLSQSRLSKL
jgi:hypothetical protein